jgi:hypothetical protein
VPASSSGLRSAVSVGVHRFAGLPLPLDRAGKMFTFAR